MGEGGQVYKWREFMQGIHKNNAELYYACAVENMIVQNICLS